MIRRFRSAVPKKVGFPIEAGIHQTTRRESSRDAPPGATPRTDRPVALLLAVAGGCGYAPVAPGTAGSLLGAGLFVAMVFGFSPMLGTGPVLLYVAAALAITLFGMGVWASDAAEEVFGVSDDGRIVVDEVTGQWITLLPLLAFVPLWLDPTLGPDGIYSFFFWVVTGFVLFRLFDVWKPGVIRWTERRFKGGFGVMIDDAVAGIHGAAVLFALVWLTGPQVTEVVS